MEYFFCETSSNYTSPANFVILTVSISFIKYARTFLLAPFENQGPVELAMLENRIHQENHYTQSIQFFQLMMIFCIAPFILIGSMLFQNVNATLISLLFLSLVIEILTPNILYHSQKKFLKILVISTIIPISNVLPLVLQYFLKIDSLDFFSISKFILMAALTFIIVPEFFYYLLQSLRTRKSLVNAISEQRQKINYILPSKLILTLLIEAPTFYLSQFANSNIFIVYDIFRKITEAFKQVIRIFNIKQIVEKETILYSRLIFHRSKFLLIIMLLYGISFDFITDLITSNGTFNLYVIFIGSIIIYINGISGALGSLVLMKQRKVKFFFITVLLGIIPWTIILFFETTSLLFHTLLVVLASELLILLGRIYYARKIQTLL